MSFLKEIWDSCRDKFSGTKIRNIYAILKGKYQGELWIIVEDRGDHYLGARIGADLTKPRIEYIPKEKLDVAIKTNICDFVNKMPKKHFKLLDRHCKNEEK